MMKRKFHIFTEGIINIVKIHCHEKQITLCHIQTEEHREKTASPILK